MCECNKVSAIMYTYIVDICNMSVMSARLPPMGLKAAQIP